MTNTTCDTRGTVSEVGNGTCVCYAQFYGEQCQYSYAAWNQISLGNDIVGLGFDTFALYWVITKLIQLYKDKKPTRNLSTVSIYINLLALCIQVVSHILGIKGVINGNDGGVVYAVFDIILVLLPPIIWMLSNSIIVGFWLDLLTKKITSQRRAWSKWTGSVGGILVALPILGIIAFIIFDQIVAGVLLIILPLFGGMVAIVITTIIVARIKIGTGEKITEKKRYALRIFSFLAVLWFLVSTAITIIFFALITYNFLGLLYWVLMYGLTACEAGIVVCLLFLVDRDFRPIRLTRYICLNNDVSITSTTGPETSSPDPRSAPGDGAAFGQGLTLTTSSDTT